MKLTADIDEMAKAIALCASLASETDTRLILKNIALVATKDTLEVIGTDLMVGMKIVVNDVDIKEPGSILLNAKKAKDIFNKSGKGRVELKADSNKCKLKLNNAKFSLPLDNFYDYPHFKSFGDDEYATLPIKEFKSLVNKSAFAAAKTATNKYAMNGVYVELEDDSVNFVACDGRRLALVKRVVEQEDVDIVAVVPTNGLVTATKLISLGGDDIKLRADNAFLYLRTNYGEIFVRLLEGQFPPYQQALSDEEGEEFSANRKELMSSIELAQLMTNKINSLIKMNFNNTGLDIMAASSDTGESDVHLPLKGFKFDPTELKFDPKSLLEALKAMEEDEVMMQFGDHASCLMLR